MIKSIKIAEQEDSAQLNISPTTLPIQRILIKNTDVETKLSISGKTNYQDIEISNTECSNNIKISMPCPCKKDIAVALDQMVPKSLSLLPTVTTEELQELDVRESGRIYVDLDGTQKAITLEELKKMNTKTIIVDEISDDRVRQLADYDFILVKQKVK